MHGTESGSLDCLAQGRAGTHRISATHGSFQGKDPEQPTGEAHEGSLGNQTWLPASSLTESKAVPSSPREELTTQVGHSLPGSGQAVTGLVTRHHASTYPSPGSRWEAGVQRPAVATHQCSLRYQHGKVSASQGQLSAGRASSEERPRPALPTLLCTAATEGLCWEAPTQPAASRGPLEGGWISQSHGL